MAVPVTFDLESPAWLRKLRWASIIGQTLTVLIAYNVGVDFHCYNILFLLGVLALWNRCLPWIEERFFSSTKSFVFAQIAFDVVMLTGVIWLSGGLVNPFVEFYALHVMIAGLLLTPLLTGMVSLLTGMGIVVLLWAPPLKVNGVSVSLSDTNPVWYGLPVALLLLIFFTTGFILIYLNRLGRANAQLRHRTKMDALGRLVAGLAHEIGTPLNSILVLSKDLESSVPQEHQKELAIIASQAKRCGDIVSLLLGYTRTLTRTNADIEYNSVQLGSWIEEIFVLLWQAQPHKTKPDFRVEITGLPEKVDVPELILRQVLENLLKNALDALDNAHEPKIRVRVYPDPYEQEMILVVEDNGPGFTKDTREQAFEAFFTTKKQGVGTGLGLYISYYLLSQLGGRIVIEEHSGPGAMIQVAFPWPQERTAQL
jgi:two-component system sensor histidine kinase RegB